MKDIKDDLTTVESNNEPLRETLRNEETNISTVPVNSFQVSNNNQVLSIIETLVSKDNFDVDSLEKLVKLQNDTEDRQAKKAFNQDFSEMSRRIPVIQKTGLNKFNGTQFARIEDIIEITRPILSDHGFSVTYKQAQDMISGAKTDPSCVFGYMTTTCILKHRLGHEEENSLILPISTIKGQTAHQAVGMMATYGRRYSLVQALNIATAGTEEDGSIASFAQNANSSKKTIEEPRFIKALKLLQDGELKLFSELLDKFDLSDDQKKHIENIFIVKEGE